MQKISDEELMADVDRQLDPTRSKEIAAALLVDPALRKRRDVYVASARLPDIFHVELDDVARARFVAAINRAPINVAPPPRPSLWQSIQDMLPSLPMPLRLAGALGLGAVIGWAGHTRLQTSPAADEIALVNGALVATGSLRQVLETEISSNGAPRSGKVGVTATFKTIAGTYCREFTVVTHLGLGCRTADGAWEVRAYEKSRKTSADAIRPVGDKSVVEAAISDTTDNIPLSADAERKMITQGWRAN